MWPFAHHVLPGFGKGDTLSFEADLDAGRLTVRKNGAADKTLLFDDLPGDTALHPVVAFDSNGAGACVEVR